jgi:hypothetical protein
MSGKPHPVPVRSSASVRALRGGAVAGVALLACLACSDAPPALEVGGVGYTEQELLGLSPTRRETLRDLTGLAVTVDRGKVDALGAPQLEREETNRLWQRVQVEEILRTQGVENAVLEARYSANPEHELTVRHLIVLSPRYEGEAARSDARAKATRALQRIRAGEPFPEVAAEVSEEPGAEGRQGLLEPGRRGAWVDEFWAAASALAVGEISPVVETQYGFHVLRLEGRSEVPFSEVRGRVAMEVAAMIAPLDGDASNAPLPDGLERSAELSALVDETAVVASFTGGRVLLSDLLDHAATLDVSTWEAVRAGADGAREEVLDAVVRRAAVRQRAEEAGVEIDPPWRDAAVEAWRGRVQQWAGVLGFREGMGPDGVKEAALEALSATGQMPQITRDEVRAIRGLLDRHFGAPAA